MKATLNRNTTGSIADNRDSVLISLIMSPEINKSVKSDFSGLYLILLNLKKL